MNKYCVYLHKDEAGTVRYVGSGTISRANLLCAKSDRGIRYQNYVENNGQMSVVILQSSLSKSESLALEAENYDRYISDFLLNSKRPIISTNVIENEILSKVSYSEHSPTQLIWNTDIGSNGAIRYKVGTTAGYKTSTGYYSIGLNGKQYRTHRIIFSLFNPDTDISQLVIDHIDGNPSNNKIENLRAVSYEINNRNISKRKENRNLPTGVYWRETRQAFVAQVVDPAAQHKNGTNKLVRKYIPISKFLTELNPYESAKEIAIQERKQMLEEINNRLDLGYSEDHGT